ncbi:DUF2079 domain-containing protein, partial [bacterium]|nr:DUF2079 domain-containing protein [bacterium]
GTLLSLFWLVLALGVIRWTAGAAGATLSEYGPRYAWMGETMGDRVHTVVTTPRAIWLPLWNVVWIVLPAALFLSVLSPVWLLLLLPAAYLMGWSQFEPMHRLYYYYSYPFIPFLYWGAAAGLARLEGWLGRFRWRQAVVGGVLLLAAGVMLALPTRMEGRYRVPVKFTERQVWIREMLREAVPPEASVVAQFDLLCQMPLRRDIYPLKAENLSRAEYWVLDRQGFLGDVNGREYGGILQQGADLVREGRARVVVDRDGLVILQTERR